MDMKNLIQRMTDIENGAKQLNESAIVECGEAMAPAPVNQGNPVTISVSLNASGKEHVADLLNMLKAAGIDNGPVHQAPQLPMRQDMDRLSAIMRDSNMESDEVYADEVEEKFANEPEEEYGDTDELSGGINRKKHMYSKAEDGDNAMAVRIKEQLLSALSEKKSKPDFLDVDKDGNKKEPMKKALKDKKKKK